MENIIENIKSIFDFNIVRRLFFLAGVAGSVAVGINLYHWIQDPTFRPLPYAVTDQSLSTIAETLDRAKIQYRINEHTGTVSVPMGELHAAKMKLAAAGVARDDGFSYSFLNDQNKLGTSQFVENARYLRALESDLGRTIRSIQGIANAKVHVAIPQNNVFADENTKPTASVIVQATPGYEDDKEKIRAIVQLVAASVPELDPTRIAITDQYGHNLSTSLSHDSLLNQEQLNFQNATQRYYENRIKTLLAPITGINKASVNVYADIDFTQKEEATENYDPKKKSLRSEQTMSENSSSSGGGGVPGALSNSPAGGGGGGGSGGQERQEKVKNYEVSKTMSYVHNPSPKIKSISVAVVLDDDSFYNATSQKTETRPMPKEKLEEITELVKTTIGYSEERKDKVTVINSSFVQNEIQDVPKVPMWEQPWFLDWAKRVGGMLLGFIFLFIVYKRIAPEFKLKKEDEAAEHPDITNQKVTPEMMALKNEQLEVLKDIAAKEPGKVAGIIRKWVTK